MNTIEQPDLKNFIKFQEKLTRRRAILAPRPKIDKRPKVDKRPKIDCDGMQYTSLAAAMEANGWGKESPMRTSHWVRINKALRKDGTCEYMTPDGKDNNIYVALTDVSPS